MTEYRYNVNKNCIEKDGKFFAYLDSIDIGRITMKLNKLSKENEQLKQQINTMIKDLQTEKETAISKNERIRLDFAITVLEELKGDVE